MMRAAAVDDGADAAGRVPLPRVPGAFIELLFRSRVPDAARSGAPLRGRSYRRRSPPTIIRCTCARRFARCAGVLQAPDAPPRSADRGAHLIMWGARDELLPVTAARQLNA